MEAGSEKSYDIIIAGAGLAGLTLALELVAHPGFHGQRVLLLDRSAKKANDRTWCFWVGPEEPLPPMVYRSWARCRFLSPGLDRDLDMAGYRYCMVRGIDFYRYAREQLEQHPEVDWVQAEISGMDGRSGRVTTDKGFFEGRWILNSAFAPSNLLPDLEGRSFERPFSRLKDQIPETHSFLLQHFKGWLVETERPVFDPARVTFMDFRVAQEGDTRFAYVLPFSATTALVEYTVFSPALLDAADYDKALADYLERHLQAGVYKVLDTEFGVIPMTDYRFPAVSPDGVIQLGSAAGFVKSSSGYAFERTQRKIRRLVSEWAKKGHPDPSVMRSAIRFRLYDSILLKVLSEGRVTGAEVFTSLFRDLPSDLVLRFLDEDTHFGEELRLMSTTPLLPFLRTAMEQMPRYGKL